MDESVTHDAKERVFRLTVQGRVVGQAEWVPLDDAMAIMSVHVDPRYGGRGYGGRLAEAALEEARARGAKVLPYCSFVREHLRRNPEHLELVPEGERARFGLAA